MSGSEVTHDTGEGLYRAFALAWWPVVGMILIPVIGVAMAFFGDFEILGFFLITLWYLLIPLLGFTMLWYKAFELRNLIGRLRFQGVQFQFDGSGGELFRLLLGNLLIMILTLGIAAPATQRRVAAFAALHLGATGVADLDNIVQSAQEIPDVGEGIADALDFGAV